MSVPARSRSNRRRSPGAPRRVTAAAALLCGAALLLTGCTGGESGDSAGGGTGSAAVGEDGNGGAEPGSAPQAAGGGAKTDSGSAVTVTPKMVKTATISLEVADVAVGAAAVRAAAAAVQGYVVSESIGSDQPRPVGAEDEPFGGFGTLVVSVPAPALDSTLTALGKVGTVLSRSSASKDVTAEYVDTESRLATMRTSVERVRRLMAQATSIGQVVTLETELSRREADLESLQSQLTALKGDVERSAVTVSLRTPANAESEQPNGFLAGLSAGWDAFAASAQALLTGLGAVLPFAVLGALIGIPLVVWLRRRPAGRGAQLVPATVTPSPAPDATSAP